MFYFTVTELFLIDNDVLQSGSTVNKKVVYNSEDEDEAEEEDEKSDSDKEKVRFHE